MRKMIRLLYRESRRLLPFAFVLSLVVRIAVAEGVPESGPATHPSAAPPHARAVPTPKPIEHANNDLDVPYLGAERDVSQQGEFGWERQTRMNVHWPAVEKTGAARYPCIVFVHGGGYGGRHKDLPGGNASKARDVK